MWFFSFIIVLYFAIYRILKTKSKVQGGVMLRVELCCHYRVELCYQCKEKWGWIDSDNGRQFELVYGGKIGEYLLRNYNFESLDFVEPFFEKELIQELVKYTF